MTPGRVDNHMLVGNRDKEDLKCPSCGTRWSAEGVDPIVFCRDFQCSASTEFCRMLCHKSMRKCRSAVDAFECECGEIFQEEI